MKKTFWTLSLTLLAASIMLFIACTKDAKPAGSNSTNPNNIPPEQTVTASLQGRVLDENGLPVQGAAVSSGLATTSTDVNGIFTFKSISLSSRFGFVKVVKQGYFAGSRSIITNAGASNYVSIKLQPRTLKTSFPAAAGGTVTIQTGVTAVFDAASIVNASTNAAYTGNVNAYATYLDPTDPDLNQHMPGDLRGIDSNGRETALQTFGMMVVELEGDAGQRLQIAPGKKATLTMAIPASLKNAPAYIPLWYFNDSTGKWIQEGTATRQGNNYTGQVGHFSYWNCDAPMGTVNFKVRLKDQHGNPLPYTYIEFQSTDIGSRGGYTDSTGFAQGLIPKGMTLALKVMTECGSLIGGASVGPALTDQDLGTLTITEDNAELTLTGSVLDCTNNPVASGYVNAFLDGLNYRAAVIKGSFTLPIHRCFSSSVSVSLTAGDYSSLQQGSVTTIKADTGTLNVGQLSACGTSLVQFINVTLNGTTNYGITAPSDSITYYYQGNPAQTNIWGISAPGVNPPIQIGFTITNLAGTGTYTTTDFDMGVGSQTFWPVNGTSIQYSVTAFGPVNGFITGNLSGTLQDTVTRTTYPMTGTFKVKRTY